MVKYGNVFCDKCGKLVGHGETVCPDCGSPISVNSVSENTSMNICTILSIVVLVFGIIGSIYLAYTYGVGVDADYSFIRKEYDYEVKRNVGSTIAIFVSGILGTLIVYTILSTLGEVKDKLNSLR